MKLIPLVLSAAMALASACATAASGFIALKDSTGTPLRAYAAGPEGARAGVLIVHDYFGITDFTKMAAERLGALGYRAIAIDLYGGRSASTHEAAVALMQALQSQDRAITDRTLQAGLEALKRPGRRLAALGFSMGGIEALQAALNDPAAVQGTVVVYGFGFDQIDPARFARLQAPLLTMPFPVFQLSAITMRRDPVFMLGQGFGLFVYLRNLWLIRRHRQDPAEGPPRDALR